MRIPTAAQLERLLLSEKTHQFLTWLSIEMAKLFVSVSLGYAWCFSHLGP